jgi:hypothetical protein
MDNNDEQFVDFMTAPTLSELMKSPECEIDNKLLYKKLVELQNEIIEMRLDIKNLMYYKQIYYPTQSYPLQVHQKNMHSKILPINNAKKQI